MSDYNICIAVVSTIILGAMAMVRIITFPALGHCDFCISYFFSYFSMRTPEISGFGGMRDRIDSIFPPNGMPDISGG